MNSTNQQRPNGRKTEAKFLAKSNGFAGVLLARTAVQKIFNSRSKTCIQTYLVRRHNLPENQIRQTVVQAEVEVCRKKHGHWYTVDVMRGHGVRRPVKYRAREESARFAKHCGMDNETHEKSCLVLENAVEVVCIPVVADERKNGNPNIGLETVALNEVDRRLLGDARGNIGLM